MLTRRARRTGRRGVARAAALAAAVVGWGCTAPPLQPPATRASLERLAAAALGDVYGRPQRLGALLEGRAVLYFFRTDCEYCASGVATARALAAKPGAPALVLISREGAVALRAALGPAPVARLVVLSDTSGALMDTALVTRFVPRVVAVAHYRVLLDRTGGGGPGLAGAAQLAASSGQEP